MNTYLSSTRQAWGKAVVIVFTAHAETVDTWAAYWLLARTGTAVAVTGGQGELTSEAHPDPDPGLLAVLQERINPIVAELCTYTRAGC